MELALPAEQMAQISQHCERAYPHEGCGILLGRVEDGRKLVVEVIPTGNAHQEDTQRNRYLIPPEQLLQAELQAEELGLEVIGYFHSHPDHPARPSECDRERAWPGYSYLITSVQKGRAVRSRSWRLQKDGAGFDEETVLVKTNSAPSRCPVRA